MNSYPKGRGDQLALLTKLSATSIRDSQGELVGRVTDLIVDLAEARLAYLNIALHPLNGGNDTFHVTVPWSIVSAYRGADGGLRVAVRRKTLLRMAHAARNRQGTGRSAP